MVRAIAARHTVSATALLDLAAELRTRADVEHRDGGANQLTPRGLGLCEAADALDRLLDDA